MAEFRRAEIYGTDGYSVEGDSQALPSYITQYSAQGASLYMWASSTTDPRALLNGVDSSRLAACLYGGSFTLDVNFTGGRTGLRFTLWIGIPPRDPKRLQFWMRIMVTKCLTLRPFPTFTEELTWFGAFLGRW